MKETDKNRVLAILQARCNSTRLPGKSIMDVGGLPSAIVCAKRASNTGIEAVLATSVEATDDPLYDLAKAYNVPVFRGSLDNVLERFAGVSDQFNDKDIIIRLTGDNLFVDGGFIEMCLDAYLANNVDYIVTDMNEKTGFPYGMSCEIFTRESLMAAAKNATSDFEKEHVTPYIEDNFVSAVIPFPEKYQKDLSGLRCTMDTKEDYDSVQKAFDGKDALNTGWVDLCYALKGFCADE